MKTRKVKILRDQPDFGLKKGQIVNGHLYAVDPDKITIYSLKGILIGNQYRGADAEFVEESENGC